MPDQSVAGDTPGSAPPVVAAPPTMMGDLGRPARRPVWPAVLGALVLAAGVLGALESLTILLSPLYLRYFRSVMPPGQGDPIDTARELLPLSLSVGAVLGVAGVMAIIGGAALIRRRAWAVVLVVAWALVKLAASLAKVRVDWVIQEAQIDTITTATGPGAMPTGTPAMVRAIMVGAVVLVLLWRMALPVAVLIWFGRRRIRQGAAAWPDAAARGRETV